MRKRTLSLLLSFTLLGLLIYFSDPLKVASTIARVNPLYILAGISIFWLNSFLRTIRWQILLKKLNIRIPLTDTFYILMAGLFISNMTPGKTGDPIRSLLLKRTHSKSFTKSVPSIFIERIADIVAMIMISLFGIFFISSEYTIYLFITILTYSLLVFLLIFILLSKKRTERFFSIVVKLFSFIPKIKNLKKDISEMSQNLHTSFSRYKDKNILFKTILLSLIIWTFEGLVLYVAFLSMNFPVTPEACITITSFSILLSIITFLPGGLGSAEIITVLTFTALFPFLTSSDVTATVLISRFMSFWMSVIVGAFSLGFKMK
ncbi:MAG: hypothetical protein DRP11_02225 [Candidatus Aenigmatarchaeota archaeon]|nr:MAG: hypothetical protein DRP11_02225 [Candidatus Aenigmarchaeota archaeon]